MKLTYLSQVSVAVAVGASIIPSSATGAAASLKGSRALQDEQESIILKSTVLAVLTSTKYGELRFISFPESPEDLVVHYKTSGEIDVLHEFMIRTTGESSDEQVEMRPDRLFEMYAEIAGMKVEVPKELKAAVDFVINNPGMETEPNVKLPELPGLVSKGNRNLEHQPRQLDRYYGSDEWFEDFYCSYREVPNSRVCKCYTTSTTPGDAGAFFSRIRNGLLQTAYNFFDGSFGHKLEKCLPSNGVCTFQTLMDDPSVQLHERSRIWHFAHRPEIIYRTHVYDAYTDMFHIAVNELKLYFFPGGCYVDGHGCYSCPNIY
jgi:hypothetical protein